MFDGAHEREGQSGAFPCRDGRGSRPAFQPTAARGEYVANRGRIRKVAQRA